MPTVSIRIPQLGEGLREAYLVDFLKSPGDSIARDEPLFTMETDKAVSDVECPHAGTLVKWLVEVDSVLEIGTEIAIVDTTCNSRTGGEVPRSGCDSKSHLLPPISIASSQMGSPGVESGALRTATRTPVAVQTTDAMIPPKTRRYLNDHNLMNVVNRISTTGRKMSIADVERYLSIENGIEQEIGLSDQHTGVEIVPGPSTSADDAVDDCQFDLVPLPKSQIRLNYRLTQAAATCVPVTLVNEWNWGRVQAARNHTREHGGPSAFAMVCWSVAKAAGIHQRFRCSLSTDGKSWRVFKAVNLGIAVSLEDDQLVTAVVRNADKLTQSEFFEAYTDAIQLARTGVDQADESTTLMVSNIGNIGMTIGIPAIVAPAVATLAIGQPVDKPVPDGESFRFERSVTATLSFDHRIANGIGAAAFLNEIKTSVEAFEL